MGTYTTSKGQVWTGEWRNGQQYRKMDTYADSASLARLTAATKAMSVSSAAVDAGYGEFSAVPGVITRQLMLK
jgi:hypothetical protein